ncbi:MAG: hypothetical protein NWQ47_08305 [Crocinitomicaceae bacterium]|jgi:hypothetical protein|nr:hypothetical protein [Crocinitomicaceae bacterium]MDP5011213.1 hypothetical protein [Crocinitomicaceae bacterium]
MKILILSFFLLPFSFLFSQGNLQFNQVVSGAGILGNNGVSTILTVPADKVWKIESVNGWADSGSRTGLTINNVSTLISSATFPIWLKAGDTFRLTVFTNPGTGYAYGPLNYYYSIIEFNIVP